MGVGSIFIKKAVDLYGNRGIKFLRSKYFIIGLLLVISSNLFLKFILISIPLSDQFPLAITSNIVIILLGIFYLKEKIPTKKYFALIFSFSGLFLILSKNPLINNVIIIGSLILSFLLFLYYNYFKKGLKK
jgi:drug/metabolite transporter (DMT)-like permease